LIQKDQIILYETNDYIVINKPPDLRKDGNYPATVHKLLTFWYPPVPLIMSLTNNNHVTTTTATPETFHYRLE
jgi:hypothetical protein